MQNIHLLDTIIFLILILLQQHSFWFKMKLLYTKKKIVTNTRNTQTNKKIHFRYYKNIQKLKIKAYVYVYYNCTLEELVLSSSELLSISPTKCRETDRASASSFRPISLGSAGISMRSSSSSSNRSVALLR